MPPVVVVLHSFRPPHAKFTTRQIEDGLRMQKVQAIVEAANQQFAVKDYSACLSTIESGMRIDAGAYEATYIRSEVGRLLF